jgi:hypothetical protein
MLKGRTAIVIASGGNVDSAVFARALERPPFLEPTESAADAFPRGRSNHKLEGV